MRCGEGGEAVGTGKFVMQNKIKHEKQGAD